MKPGRAFRARRCVAWLAAVTAFVACLAAARTAAAAPSLRVGSKRFTESYILAEIVRDLAKRESISVAHDRGLGGTAVTYRALEDGAIDLYPEYTGTLAETVSPSRSADLDRLRAEVAPRGLAISDPLGFENSYALATTRATATRLGLTRISDLAKNPGLKFGVSHEFAGRSDGWPGLAARYGLPPVPAATLDHALAYEALVRRTIDVTDVYTTDAKIARYDLVVLEDDAHFFPPYEAVLVYRKDVLARHPRFARVLEALHGRIDAETMRSLSARAELDGEPFARVAQSFVSGGGARGGADAAPRAPRSFGARLASAVARHGPRHVALVFGSLFLSTVVGIPLGIVAFRRRRAGAVVLGLAGVVQTIPSLALFCFMIPLLGIGPTPALAALFLYGLLPIVRNTHAGLVSIPADLRETSIALGLSSSERLRRIELPLASRTILAGLKTSAVVAVGSATIAAFIGAGGFGEPISTGLSLNDVPTILEGAIPAAILALVVQLGFDVLERFLVPRGLRDA